MVVIGVVGAGTLNGLDFSSGTAPEQTVSGQDQQQTANSADSDAAIAALAAVTAAVETVQPVAPIAPEAEPANVSQRLAALLEVPVDAPAQQQAPAQQPDPAADVEVTRSQGLAAAPLAATSQQIAARVTEQLAEPVPSAPQADTGTLGVDFFSAAQANLARANSCANDLRNLASVAKVYFPAGALNGEASGIEQARLIGTIASRCRGVTIEVLGHSDPSGDPAVNLRLSRERAEAVIARIATAGIDTSNFVAVGVGSAQPSGITGPQPAAYYDRRVEFAVLDTAQDASLTAPLAATGGPVQLAACVAQLQNAAASTSIAYAPGSVTVSPDDLNDAIALAQLAASCPQARLRVVGQFAEEYGTVEDPSTARLRAITLISSIAGQGVASDDIIVVAPSNSQPVAGLSNSRVDFDVLVDGL